MIRPFEDADWAQVWPFFEQIVRAGDTYTYRTDLTSDQAREVWVQAPPGRTVVFTEGSQLLGTAEMCPNRDGPGAHVANASFMVDPAAGGRGTGRALVEFTIEQCRTDGYRALQFNAVAASNRHAVRLYERLGFAIVGTVPGAFHHPTEGYVGLHVMHLPLT
ncbi:MAG: family N-acetyltransferase [Frankiales bacterium]|nr:family N-acetyltransferase [Frankiales bacterium]